MIKNEDTYCIIQHKIVRELGAWEAVVYGTIANLLRKTDGIGEVSNQTIMDMCGIKRASFFRYISTLIESGYIEKRSGDGRGNISIYYITKKGLNLIPFSSKKGSQNETERVSKMNEKGLNLIPINKGENKEINKESGDDMHASAQSHALSNTTPQNFENMEDFNLWFELFTGGSEWQHEKENCERVWFGMTQQWRDNMVQMAQNGLRWRKRENENPYWYLKNYNGEVAQVELPYLRQGTKEFENWYNGNLASGTKMVLMRYRKQGDRDDAPTLAYCLETDKQIMLDSGAEYLRDIN